MLGDCYYVTNDVAVGRRSFCLHTFGIFCKDKMSLVQSKYMYEQTLPHHFSKLNFVSKV